jgi:hypothetical protein
MVAGSPGIQIDTAPWRRALLVWMLIILAETAHGMVRELFIAPVIGDLRARQVGVLIGSVIVLGVAWLTALWLNARTRRLQFAIGALWVALTLTFEILVGRAIGASWERIFSDFNPVRGGFMLAGLAILFFAPRIAARLRGIDSGSLS